MSTLVAIQIGQPQAYPADPSQSLASQPWRTGIYKTPVNGPVDVSANGVDGDGQADRKHHGGIDKAICVYSAEHFEYWRQFLGRDDFGPGGFGENFSVAELDERHVHLGDRWRIGSAEFEVSQPRQPCWKLARRWGNKSMTAQTIANGKTGWYMRVTEVGTVNVDDTIQVLTPKTRPGPAISIAKANQIFYSSHFDRKSLSLLVDQPALSTSWREEIFAKIAAG